MAKKTAYSKAGVDIAKDPGYRETLADGTTCRYSNVYIAVNQGSAAVIAMLKAVGVNMVTSPGYQETLAHGMIRRHSN